MRASLIPSSVSFTCMIAWLLTSLPATAQPLAVAATETITITQSGRGPVVVLIPGLIGSAYGYRHIVDGLERAGYRAVVVEPLGIGTSGRPADADYSLAAQAARVAAALDSLAARDAIVVGHGVGAGVAYRLAAARPEQVRAVLSLNGGVIDSALTSGFRSALRFAPLLRLVGGRGIVRGKISDGLIASSGDASWVTADAIDGYLSGALHDLGASLRAYRAMGAAREPALLPQLTRVRCPVLLLVGGVPHAEGPPPAEIALLAGHLAAFMTDTVPGAGQFLHEERPDAVLAAIARLDGQTAAPDPSNPSLSRRN